ncbi:copper-translocating P-type ATPase [Tenuifilaceae bacterium CYCD]|nr:copper-translocating P-type ATPase [Tenuifilaceae bacterium CYCD]
MQVVRKIYPVTGMSCAGCAISVESMLKSQQGVIDAGVNFANSTVWVNYNTDEVDETRLRGAIRSIGYDLIIDSENPQLEAEQKKQLHQKHLLYRMILSAVFSIPLITLGMFFMDWKYTPWLSMIIATPVVFWFGRDFFINAYKQTKHFKANMDTLVALSTSIAYTFSVFNTIYPEFWHSKGLHAHIYYESASVIITFILLGKWLEERAKGKTSSSIKKLMGLQPDKVWIESQNDVSEVPISQVVKGDTVLIKPGDRIPVDGTVTDGSSWIDESTITGESIPVEKDKGKKVWAGTLNQRGSLKIVAEQVGSETVLGRIIKTVDEAQNSKAPVQKLADKVAGIFVPSVLIISIITFLTWFIFDDQEGFTRGLLSMVTVLAIACPCALGLATPTAIIVGVGKAAEHNILIHDAESLEIAHRINYIVLDKTGTLTEGYPTVREIVWFTNKPEHSQILKLLEFKSEHPLADSIVRHLNGAEAYKTEPTSYESITGLGVKARLNANEYFIGNNKLMQTNNVIINENQRNIVENFEQEACTVVFFAENQDLLAIVAITDKIKPTTKHAISELQKKGIGIEMLTGDSNSTASVIASEIGIKNYKAQVLPSEKAEIVTQTKSKGLTVAMVGDGINDTEALALADVSIAMGKGSDIAIDVAKITIINSDLTMIAKAIEISKRTMTTIKQNLFWAFIYNIIGIPIAAGILYPFLGFTFDPMIAGVAMAMSSVSVVSNSLRLKRIKL